MEQRYGRFIPRMLIVIGLGFASLGQYYFHFRRAYVWDGVFFWGIGLCAFLLLLRCSRRASSRSSRQPFRFLWRWLIEQPGRALAAVGGAMLSVVVGWLAAHGKAPDYTYLLWGWLIGIAWFVLAFVPFVPLVPSASFWTLGRVYLRGRNQRWRDKFRSPQARRAQKEWAALLFLLMAALVLRAADLEHIPANLGGDEGTQGVAALRLLGPPLGNPFATGWFGVPTMSFLAYGAAMRVLGSSIAGLRALSALVGTATVLTTFLLGRELWGRRVAWLSAIALTVSHYHIHFSRLGSNQIADGLVATLALYFLVRGLRSRRTIHFALTGLVVGLGWYVYFGARLVGALVGLYLIWWIGARWNRRAADPGWIAEWGRRVGALALSAGVALAPLLIYYWQHPDSLNSRARQVSIFASGWLEQARAMTGRSTLSLLLQQFWKAVSAFNYTLDPTFWYHPTIPLLDLVGGGLFVLGMVWTIWRWRRWSNRLLLLWFWMALVLGWVLTENPPSSQRMTIIAPALSLLIGLGARFLNILLNVLYKGIRARSTERREQMYAVLSVVMVVLNVYYYFGVYTPTRVYGNPTAEAATELGRYLIRQDDDAVIYFFAPPFMYWEFGTLQFLAWGREGRDVPPEGISSLPPVDRDRGARFVFLPERMAELETVRAEFPAGHELTVRSTVDGRVLFVVYEAIAQ